MDRPSRRTKLLPRKLLRYNVDIAVLSDTSLADEVSITEYLGGYTFHWHGLPTEERRIHGVGYAKINSLVKSLHSTPIGISERLMKLRLPLSNDRYTTFLSCYAPSLDTSAEISDSFYEYSDSELPQITRNDKFIVLGDFDAGVRSTHVK